MTLAPAWAGRAHLTCRCPAARSKISCPESGRDGSHHLCAARLDPGRVRAHHSPGRSARQHGRTSRRRHCAACRAWRGPNWPPQNGPLKTGPLKTGSVNLRHVESLPCATDSYEPSTPVKLQHSSVTDLDRCGCRLLRAAGGFDADGKAGDSTERFAEELLDDRRRQAPVVRNRALDPRGSTADRSGRRRPPAGPCR